MFKRLTILTLLSAALTLQAAYADIKGNDACQALVAEGNVLFAKNAYQDALNKYSQAAKADPTASTPVALIADVLLRVSQVTGGDNAAKLRQQSETAARQALQLAPQDPVAQEILRFLQDDKPASLHTPSPEAYKLVSDGEVLFQSGKFADALQKYEQAAQVDPLFSQAWVFAGDCFYSQKKWPEAEARFRKATDVEPLNSQAWRFLSDALLGQGKRTEAESALLSGIAAQPSQLPNWDKLGRIHAAAGAPLAPLQLVRKAQAKIDPANGKSTVEVDQNALANDSSADMGFWLGYALKSSNMATAKMKGQSNDKPVASSFGIEIEAWRAALTVAGEAGANSGKKLTDPALLKMQMLAKADQLEPAVFLLLYKESYRPEFEAWKKAHPDGIKTFVDAYGLRP